MFVYVCVCMFMCLYTRGNLIANISFIYTFTFCCLSMSSIYEKLIFCKIRRLLLLPLRLKCLTDYTDTNHLSMAKFIDFFYTWRNVQMQIRMCLQWPCEVGTITGHILQMMKLAHREFSPKNKHFVRSLPLNQHTSSGVSKIYLWRTIEELF